MAKRKRSSAQQHPHGSFDPERLYAVRKILREDVRRGLYYIDWADDADWRHIKISDEKIKFALAKRVMQLTGTKIPDHALSKANELGILMQQGFRWKRPERLAKELLTESKDFKKNKKWDIAPNVTVHTKRETYVNKEKSVGRWKVIEKELKKRDLHLPRRSNRAFS